MSNKETLIEFIASERNLENSYRKVMSGPNKYHKEAIEFSKNLSANLLILRESLLNRTYKFEGYIEFKVYEPKERVIHAPHFVDKIVQIAINNALQYFIPRYFIKDSYACIINRGTHKAVDKVQEYIRKAYEKWGYDAFIIKLDIRKFFYSIDRTILKRILKPMIKCNESLLLLYKIIDSAIDISEVGLPLGNTTSQLLANVYMNKFDQFCKRILKIKYYVRYMDDAITIVENKEIAKRLLIQMDKFLLCHLKLEIDTNKTKVFPIRQGVNAYGFKIYITHRLLRDDSKKKIKRKIRKMPRLIIEGRLDIETATTMLNSWLGHAKYANSHNFIMKLVNKHDFITYENNKFIINEETILSVSAA